MDSYSLPSNSQPLHFQEKTSASLVSSTSGELHSQVHAKGHELSANYVEFRTQWEK